MKQATNWCVCRGPLRRDGTRRYYGRLKLPGQAAYTRVPLGFTDRRVARQKMAEIAKEREMIAVGLAVPPSVKQAAQRPLKEHLEAFLRDVKAKGRAVTTEKHYRKTLRRLFDRCGWRKFGDVSGRSFCEWRARSGLAPKFLNDLLSSGRTFFRWLERQEISLSNPLGQVEKVRVESAGHYRRALSVDEVNRLLAVAPPQRAWVYLAIIYTGLRRKELNQVTWGHCKLDGDKPCIALPGTVTKNRKTAVIYLRPEVVAALRDRWIEGTRPGHPVFRGKVPSVAKLKEDLASAKISVDGGERVDVHALRKTFGTMLSTTGAAPRVAMEAMRHSDLKLTMNLYTFAPHLPVKEAIDNLPSFRVPAVRSLLSAQTSAQNGVAEGVRETQPDAKRESLAQLEPVDTVALRRTETQPAAISKMVGAVRFELTIAFLAPGARFSL